MDDDTARVGLPEPPTHETTFAQRLGLLRATVDPAGELSVLAFSKRCGVPNTAMRNYLAGASLPSVDNLDAIARATGASLEWLVRGYGSSPSLDRAMLREVLRITLEPLLRRLMRADASAGLAESIARETDVLYALAAVGGPEGRVSLEAIRRTVEQIEEATARVVAARAMDSSP